MIWSEEREVRLLSEYEPFLRPSELVNYDRDSDCVKLAGELTEDCEGDVEKVSVIYHYLVTELRYDYEKARSVKSGYLPEPDRILQEKKGICFDYASLAASMLRSVGIPCRLIMGYVEPDGIYHAWNEIYLKDKGWITVKIKVKGMVWKHVDITFASNSQRSSASLGAPFGAAKEKEMGAWKTVPQRRLRRWTHPPRRGGARKNPAP